MSAELASLEPSYGPITLRPLPEYESHIASGAEIQRNPPHRWLQSVAEQPSEEPIDSRTQLVIRGFFTAVAEVLDGRRPVAQLRSQLSEKAYASLETRAKLAQRGSQPSKIRIGRMYRPTSEAIEVSATLDNGQRIRAIAARIDLVNGMPSCSVLRLL